jgi:hypothetical protein
MQRADIVNVDGLDIGGGEPDRDAVPEHLELPAAAVVVGDHDAANEPHGILGGEGDVSSVPVLDAPEGDLATNVGDPELVHPEIIDPCKPRRPSATNCDEVE